MLKPYIQKLSEIANRGDAREESYYSALEGLLNEYADSTNKRNIQITTLPKKTEAGYPDFRIWDGQQHKIGYIEAKAPTIEHLDQIQVTDQLKRYRDIFHNLILTNFFEFRLYRHGDLIYRVSIARPFVIHKLQTIPPIENEDKFFNLLDKFFSFSLPVVRRAEELATELSKKTRFLRDDVITQELRQNERLRKDSILGFYEAFREYLIAGLTREEFADLYAQTITFGLFAARTRSGDGFNRKLAYDKIPPTIGILKDVFRFISLGSIPQQMECIIDDISEILAVTDVNDILHQYFHEGKGQDPIFYFYETFLATYDPKTRAKRGVYYTPESVVSYVVRSLHLILKEHFNRADGLASESVTVLDPAAGTLTFLAEAAKLAVDEFVSKYGDGGKQSFIKDHILKNFYAFELMMAPYAVGHLKMSILLEEMGYRLKEDDRFKLYLTNTLEMEDLAQTEIPGLASLSEESHLAGEVKKEKPILVILGNPPYSGHSANASTKYITTIAKNGKEKRQKVKTWIGNLIEDYKLVDGKSLGEKNPKWLQDDYVKFIRFAQWKIDQKGEGILGFITNHSYLDNPTFRGMRQSLMQTFDRIYVIDLHGNSLKKEKCPDGSKDENVFDIQQGVAILLCVKKDGIRKKISHSEIWGIRETKNRILTENDINKTRWKTIKPKSDFYFFIPRDEKLLSQYQTYTKITDIFPVNSVGIVTARDNLTIKWTPDEIWTTALNFSRIDIETARQAYNLGKDARDWKVALAQDDLIKSGLNRKQIVPILYRPFDTRYTYYTGRSRGFHCMPRPEVMSHMMHENLGLITVRQVAEGVFNHAYCTDTIVESRITLSNKGIAYLFPLYLYHEKTNPQNPSSSSALLLFEPKAEYEAKRPNLSPALIEKLEESYKKQPTPEQIFFYIYAVMYSNIYRTKYAEFLKIDFPRIPFTKKLKLFEKMAEFGRRLVDLHLLKSEELDPPVAKCHGRGDNKVEKLQYNDTEKRIYFNQIQYFEGVTKNIWEYQIGGYQVCAKWLKDRKGRELDVRHFCRIVTALQKTIEIQKDIDYIYPQVEKEII